MAEARTAQEQSNMDRGTTWLNRRCEIRERYLGSATAPVLAPTINAAAKADSSPNSNSNSNKGGAAGHIALGPAGVRR